MPFRYETPCRYHATDREFYCGAAAAQMILRHHGIAYEALTQRELMAKIRRNSKNRIAYYSSPKGLRRTLDDHLPRRVRARPRVHRCQTREEADRLIVASLMRHDFPPAVLIHGRMHWVVVIGFDSDVSPSSSREFKIRGFWVHNPVLFAGTPPPPHGDDDACGKDYAHGSARSFYCARGWRRIFTGSGRPQREFTVIAPEVVNGIGAATEEIDLPTEEPARWIGSSQERATRRSLATIRRLQAENQILRDSSARELELEATSQIRRLDDPESRFFYLPIRSSEGIIGVANSDSRGNLEVIHPFPSVQPQAAISVPEVRRHLHPAVGHEEVDPITLAEVRRGLQRASLVWKPCTASPTPLLPFYRVVTTTGPHYARTDGSLFLQLH